MKRGEIWTAAGGADHAGKPRPIVIIQDERFETRQSVTICSLTTDATDAGILRPLIEPNETNGLRLPSRLMVDKITTIPRMKLRSRIGQLGEGDMARLTGSIVVFLRLAR